MLLIIFSNVNGFAVVTQPMISDCSRAQCCCDESLNSLLLNQPLKKLLYQILSSTWAQINKQKDKTQ